MPKAHSEFVCRECGFRTPRPLGRCPGCDAWGSLDAVAVRTAPARVGKPALRAVGDGAPAAARAVPPAQSEAWVSPGLPVPIEEFARVLGGGIVQGSLVLIGGDPGVGKSTLLTQVADAVADTAGPVLYVS